MIAILGLELDVAQAKLHEYGHHDVKVVITRAPRRGEGEFSVRVVKWDEKTNTLYGAEFITELALTELDILNEQVLEIE